MSQFLELYNLQIDAEDPNYSMEVVLQHNVNRYYHSLNTNPYFWYGPIGGTVVRNAAYCFMGRLFANYSAEYPLEGRLCKNILFTMSGKPFIRLTLLTEPTHIAKDTLKSFFAVSGPEGAFVYNRGQERIPNNYYRRPTPYDVVEVALDITSWAKKHPFILK